MIDADAWSPRPAPNLETIEALALTARDRLPEPFRAPAMKVLLRVAEFPPDTMLEDMGLSDAFELTGLYDGIPLTEKLVSEPDPRPDTIWLFRRPILDEWCERGNEPLGGLVAHVYVHELAHHFGWSDADIAQIDRWWE